MLDVVKQKELSPSQLATLSAEARHVLNFNDRDFFITPSEEFYGAGQNNWGYLWDTAFSTMAMAKYDPERARALFENYLSLQHSSGRIPHMGMWSSSFPIGTLVTNWNWHGHRHQQKDLFGNLVKTSPITQPPLLAVAAGAIADNLPSEARAGFARRAAHRLIKYHAWIYKEREIKGDGLVITIHPHETGRDDAPTHKDLLQAMPKTFFDKIFSSSKGKKLFARYRTDKSANPEERSDTDTVMQASSLALFGLPRLFNADGVPKEHPYQHFDPGFNAILDRANDELQRVAAMGGIAIPKRLLAAMGRTSSGLQLFWDDKTHAFRGLDARGRVEFTPGHEIGDLLPIYSRSITQEQADSIVHQLSDPGQFGGDNLPTVTRRSSRYDADRFWQGADWDPMRQLITDGLRAYGHMELARSLSQTALLRVLQDKEFPEYRDSDSGEPKGARRFSWSAALTINAAEDLYDKSAAL